ncbi:UDP-glycosyltransferase 91D2-like [Primulina eburnea]|uniref:UDP-glycosyltransferase 91D2-like n=1 Tax=Primulina eburnea TaxID=1245227 RepID=UPI003C6BEB09
MAKQRNLHIVMFPWLAFGHMIPYLELSKFIARKGHQISIISTPRNIDRLPELPPDLASSITFIKIPLPKISQLHETAEATADIKYEDMHHLKRAFDGMESELTRFLEGSSPDWIIYDFAPHWLPPVAARLGISRALFLITNAWFLAYIGPLDTMINGSDYRTRKEDFTVPPEWVKFETKVAYRLFEAEWILGSAQDKTSGFTDFYRLGKSILGSEAILIRHCYEFERDWLKVVEELYQRPVIPLGLMPPCVQDSDCSDVITWISVRNWLDGQSRGSVVYVALGSEVALTQSQLSELALGLELSGVPFLWAMRKPSESSNTNLPDGFEERVKGDRGLLWKGWVPQLKILSHESVGGFLTHCGWSSIVEGLMFGHPLITLPFLVDQGLNSRVVAQNLVGAEIPRNESDGSYTKDSVANTIRNVMVENEGEMLMDNARKVSGMFRDKQQNSVYLEKFMEFLENHRSKGCA